MTDTHPLPLRAFHQNLGARFTAVNGAEAVADFGDVLAEYAALRETAGVLDLSFRGRLCLTGADRGRFLHGQVTNDVKKLRVGEGCYAALVTAKGKMQSDLNLFVLQDELLLDFEPGLTQAVSQRLEKYIVADDVQVVDVAPQYGLLSVQGPRAEAVVLGLGLFAQVPNAPLNFMNLTDATLGEIYLMNQPRIALVVAGILPAVEPRVPPGGKAQDSSKHAKCSDPNPGGKMPPSNAGEPPAATVRAGLDLFVPTNSLGAVADKLIAAAKSVGGRACGWTALETARIEAGIPRFGVDMDETNIPLECGIEGRAVSYTKGCYIGQEVINRIHSIGHVNRELRGLRLVDDLKCLPARGDKLFKDDKEVGYVTSAITSHVFQANIALGYVRREANAVGTELRLRNADGESNATISELPL